MMKTCARNGCKNAFFNGYNFRDMKYLCEKCGKEFMMIMDNYGERCRKYVEQDFFVFIATKVGEKFTPCNYPDSDQPISSFCIFFQDKVEIIHDESEEEENSFEKRFEERYKTHQNNPKFVENFRKLLANCSDEALIELMRCGEIHAINHKLYPDCKDCENSDDEIELSHNTKSLGNIWINAMKEIEKQEN